ncbi:MAG: hypothetical protein R8P61_05140 [Bacteroidia bacterium]|nr:hypothetical protein [Bacteroidia bacterium]
MLKFSIISFKPYFYYLIISIVHKDVHIKRTASASVTTYKECRITGISFVSQAETIRGVFLEKVSHHVSGLRSIIYASRTVNGNLDTLCEIIC